MRYFVFVAVFALFITGKVVFANPPTPVIKQPYWFKTFDLLDGPEYGQNIVVTDDQIEVAGFVKTSLNRFKSFSMKFDFWGEQTDLLFHQNSLPILGKITQTRINNFYVTGYADNGITPRAYMLDSSGTVLPNSDRTPSLSPGRGQSIWPSYNGGVNIFGNLPSFLGGFPAWEYVRPFGRVPIGAFLFFHDYFIEYACGIESVNGNLIIGGSAAYSGHEVSVLLVRNTALPGSTALDGAVLQLDGQDLVPLSIVETRDGGFVVAAMSTLYMPAGEVDIYVAKVDGDFNLQWERRIINQNNLEDIPVAIIEATHSSELILLANHRPTSGSSLHSYVTLRKLNGLNGATVWTRIFTLGGESVRAAGNLTQDSHGSLLFTGATEGGFEPHLFVVRASADGTIQ